MELMLFNYRINITRKWLRICFALFFSFLMFCLVIQDREQIFTLNARTEIVMFKNVDRLFSEWEIGNAVLHEDPIEAIDINNRLDSAARLILAENTTVTVQRHGNQVIRIQLKNDENKSVGQLTGLDGSDRALGSWALFMLDINKDTKPLLLPFRGTLTAGDDVAAGVNSILLGGTINVVEERLFGKTHYTAGDNTLDIGDRVQFWKECSYANKVSNVPSIRKQCTKLGFYESDVSGFIRAEPNNEFTESENALAVIAHGQADHVEVNRLGSSGYQVIASNFARFVYDPIIAALVGFLAFLVLLLDFILKLDEITDNGKKK